MSKQKRIYPDATVNDVQNSTWAVCEGVWYEDEQRFGTWCVYSVEHGYYIGEFNSKQIALHVARIHNKQQQQGAKG